MKKLVSAILCITLLLSANAQRTCGTMAHHQMLLQTDPQYAANRQAIEQMTNTYLANGHQRSSRNIITIPVVVHVVYNTSTQNITDAQVFSQIARLNLDFRKLNADTNLIPAVWDTVAADYEIEFCLAQRDPNGLPTNGIDRVSTNTIQFTQNDNVKHANTGGADAWSASDYLNLWVCNLGGGLLGYTQFPGGAAATDGVVITYTGFGDIGTAATPYNLGRTSTHEIGHWLNLLHTWGDDNGACTGSDNVNDTPNEANANYGCPAFPLTDNCSPNSPGVMFMDYMDYSDDACLYMFTKGQKQRSAALFTPGGARASILNSLGCVPTNSGPLALFSASKTTICVGQSVTFTNGSYGNPTTFHWSFVGGSDTVSTLQTPPVITYHTPGTYAVSLTVSDAAHTSTKNINAYITVLGAITLPLSEGFENSTFPTTSWQLLNPDNQTAWVRSTAASGFGTSTACAFFDNYTVSHRGAYDYLYTPIYDFTQGTSATTKLKFDYAYAQRRPTSHDSLIVMYSTDCGQTWTNLWSNGGSTMATTTTVYGNSVYVPATTEWIRDSSVSLASLVGQSAVQFAFVNYSNHGNALYLDNVNIDAHINVGISEPTADIHLLVMPNPTKDRCNVSLSADNFQPVQLNIINMLGQKIWNKDMGVIRTAQEEINLTDFSQGIYIVQVKTGERSYTARIVKE